MVPPDKIRNISDPFKLLTADISVKWHVSDECFNCHYKEKGNCTLDSKYKFYCANSSLIANIPHIRGKKQTGKEGRSNLTVILGIGSSISGVVMVVVFFCLWKKCSHFKSTSCCFAKTKDHHDIEVFLKKYGTITPQRYRYSDIKKMTNSFRDKLGHGGFGDVYKGILLDGRVVAVKVLNKTKSNGEEFVNEVASISRTSHVNIVSLLGFCYDVDKRALVYEFMSNGSLEKFICNKDAKAVPKLGWNMLYEIAVGIARGLEYLHRGCNTRILHFDIKPHNILLNEEFCSKISDFGLARLCPEENSVISMLGMRGTPGYIAPEVFSRNFGRVSHKSDVYSYGMMVLEMVGWRNNSTEGADGSSEYFPHWIYSRLELSEEFGVDEIMNRNENENIRKMVIVSLWCTQTDPSSRPSINKVLEMLEGRLESLKIRQRPLLNSPPEAQADSSTIETLENISN